MLGLVLVLDILYVVKLALLGAAKEYVKAVENAALHDITPR